MSQRQGVVKRDFMFPAHKAILFALRGQNVQPGASYENIMAISLVQSLNPAQNQSTGVVPILDFLGVKKMTNYPYVTVGDASLGSSDDTKGGSGEQIIMAIHIWSQYNGRYETDFIGGQVLNLLTKSPIDLSSDGFSCYGLRKEFDRTTKEGEVIHRVMRLRLFMEDLQTIQPIQ